MCRLFKIESFLFFVVRFYGGWERISKGEIRSERVGFRAKRDGVGRELS